MKNEINKAISKSKKLELWEHMYQMEKEIEELKREIKELKKEIKPIWFVPEKDEDFYYIDAYGNVRQDNVGAYNSILERRQVFKTKEEANNYLKVMKAESRLRKELSEWEKE